MVSLAMEIGYNYICKKYSQIRYIKTKAPTIYPSVFNKAEVMREFDRLEYEEYVFGFS